MAESAAVRPNFVVILADDLGYGDVSPAPFGSPVHRTPRLERMAREGLTLGSFYVSAPLCSPTRASLLTGCYHARVSINRVLIPGDSIGLNPAETTIAEVLRAAGYRTGCFGKWHVGDQPEFLPTRRGFDTYYGVPYSNDMQPRGDREGDQKPIERRYPLLPVVRDETVERGLVWDQETLTEELTNETIAFIEANRERPFFAYLALTAVHIPHIPGAAFRGTSGQGPYGDWVLETDYSVGRILDAVQRLGLDERTLVIFTSDNGPSLNFGGSAGVLRGGKGSTFEGGVREPFIARWPGRLPAGARSDAPVAAMDLLPTFAAYAGAALPEREIDGVDVRDLLQRPDAARPPREEFCYFGFYPSLEAAQEEPIPCAIRSGPWKLHVRLARRPLAAPQLYNLDHDVGETRDVAADHPDVVERLAARLREAHEDLRRNRRPPGRNADPQTLLPRLDYSESLPAYS
jgi:arylsulfatase A-like enzyme